MRSRENREAEYLRLKNRSDWKEEDRQWLDAWIAADPESDQEYLDLLARTNCAAAGEISPFYSIADMRTVRRIRDAFSSPVRIIYILRNPIDRDWSHMKFELHHINKHLQTLSADSYLRALSTQNMKRRSDYVRNIERWTKVFSSEGVLVTFHDRIRRDPERFLEEICAFVGVKNLEPSRIVKNMVYTIEQKMPREVSPDPTIRRRLAKRHLRMLKVLADQYPDPSADWMLNAKALIKRRPV